MRKGGRFIAAAVCAMGAAAACHAGEQGGSTNGDVIAKSPNAAGLTTAPIRAASIDDVLAASKKLRDEGRLDEAARVIADAQAHDPDHRGLEIERLSIRQAQGKLTPAEAQMLQALVDEQTAATELAIGSVRLSMIRAKARLAQGKWDDAERSALMALDRVQELPPDVDRKALIEPLTALIEEARQARQARTAARSPRMGVDIHATDMGTALPQDATPASEVAPSAAPANQQPAQRNSGEAPTIGYPSEVTVPWHFVRVPSLSSVRFDQEQEAFEQVELLRQGIDPRIRSRIVAYPSDWQELSELRKPYRTGLLYRGPDVVGDDGQSRYTAVYDIADVLADVPNFSLAPILDLEASMQAHADRIALRQSSDIFTGSVRDLAEGIPLLSFFGGVDEYHLPPTSPGVQYSYGDIERMVSQVLSAP